MRARGSQHPELSAPEARGERGFSRAARAAGAEAVSAALASLIHGGEAPRVGVIGNTGAGKTVATHALAEGYLRASPGALIVIDNKAEGRYDDLPGARIYESLSQLAIAPQGRCWILKPRVFAGHEIDPEEVAQFQWRLRGHRLPSCVLNDELVPHAAVCGQWKHPKGSLPKCFVQGRSHGLSQIWGTTALQDVPLQAAAQSSELWVFQTRGTGLRILRERDYLIGVPPGTVEAFAGYPLPAAERGEFARLVSGVPWDGVTYKFV